MQKTLGLLFAADRLILMDKIEQLEKDNVVVISDRSFYSSLSYQDPQDWIKEINKFAKMQIMVRIRSLLILKKQLHHYLTFARIVFYNLKIENLSKS